MVTGTTHKVLSDKEKEELLKQVLGQEYSKAGKNLPVLKNAIDVIGKIDDTLSFAELIPAIETVLAGSRILSFVATGASTISIFLFPVASMIDVINAYQVGHRMYALRCVAYTITSWAFDKAVPSSSVRILNNLRNSAPVAKPSTIQEYNRLWTKTSNDTIVKINSELAAKNISKKILKISMRALGKNNPVLLCDLIMKGFENKFSPIVLLTWKSNYSIKYPG
jgi:hypothetical protein